MATDTRNIASPRRFWLIVGLATIALVMAALPGCDSAKPNSKAPVLLFSGAGASPNDVAAFEQILGDARIDFATVDSAQLSGMSASQLASYRLLIFPGGNFIEIEQQLAPETPASIRQAVRAGTNYLGVCAGAFLAGGGPRGCFDLTEGRDFGFYSAEDRGIRKAVAPITLVDAPVLEHYWEDGPELSGWGEVVGKYADETPAIVQGTCGKGFVLLCGVHPEAPQNWRAGMSFTTPVSATTRHARQLIEAALNKTPLSHF